MGEELVDFTLELVSQLNSGPAGVRMNILQARCDGPEQAPAVEVIPIVALATKNRVVYIKAAPRDKPPPFFNTHDALLSGGWRVQERGVCVQPIIIDPQTGTLEIVASLQQPGLVRRIVACPWPPEQDNERLAPDLEILVEQVMREAAKLPPLPPTAAAEPAPTEATAPTNRSSLFRPAFTRTAPPPTTR